LTSPGKRPFRGGFYDENKYCTVCRKWHKRSEVDDRCPKCHQMLRDRPKAKGNRVKYDIPDESTVS